jgi:hypothetical protein
MNLMPGALEIDIKVDRPQKLARFIVSHWRTAKSGNVQAKAAMATVTE